MTIVEFCSNFVGSFLRCLSWCLRGSENKKLLRNHICWNISCPDTHIAGMPKSAISFKFPPFCNSLVKKYKFQSLHLCLNRKPSVLLVKECSISKIIGFVLCDRILINRQCEKFHYWRKVTIFKTFISITRLIFSIKLRIESSQLVANHLIG